MTLASRSSPINRTRSNSSSSSSMRSRWRKTPSSTRPIGGKNFRQSKTPKASIRLPPAGATRSAAPRDGSAKRASQCPTKTASPTRFSKFRRYCRPARSSSKRDRYRNGRSAPVNPFISNSQGPIFTTETPRPRRYSKMLRLCPPCLRGESIFCIPNRVPADEIHIPFATRASSHGCVESRARLC